MPSRRARRRLAALASQLAPPERFAAASAERSSGLSSGSGRRSSSRSRSIVAEPAAVKAAAEVLPVVGGVQPMSDYERFVFDMKGFIGARSAAQRSCLRLSARSETACPPCRSSRA